MVHVGHVEIFLPTDQGIIRPSEDNQINIHGETISHGRKLFLNIKVIFIDIVEQFDILKAFRCSQLIN